MSDIVIYIAGGMFFLGAVLALFRIIRGPSVLDRVTASDALLGTVLCVLGFEMVLSDHTFTLSIMLAISVFAMLSAVSIARYIRKKESGDERE
ncbi:MAG: monovalent cation/H+ antiporter complex subunit F [Microbacteriaceae bacterium]